MLSKCCASIVRIGPNRFGGGFLSLLFASAGVGMAPLPGCFSQRFDNVLKIRSAAQAGSVGYGVPGEDKWLFAGILLCRLYDKGPVQGPETGIWSFRVKILTLTVNL
jgi:hypothetical protein